MAERKRQKKNDRIINLDDIVTQDRHRQPNKEIKMLGQFNKMK